MIDHFDKLIDEVIEREGGYVDHPSDRGGPTKYGITHITAKRYGFRGHIRDLPRAEAKRIYWQRYVIEPGFYDAAKHSLTVAAELFDTGVNMGQSVATGFLQTALNALNRQGRDYPDITVDGDYGSATHGAFGAYLRTRRGADGISVLMKALEALQGARYLTLAHNRPANEDFVFGWLRTRINGG